MRCPKTGKVGHATREAACAARKAVGHILAAYRCSHCKRWHLGNTPNTRAANMDRLCDKVAKQEGWR